MIQTVRSKNIHDTIWLIIFFLIGIIFVLWLDTINLQMFIWDQIGNSIWYQITLKKIKIKSLSPMYF